MKDIQFIDKDLFAPQDSWNRLSMTEKADMIKAAVKNGIYNLKDIRAKYNEFAEGGSKVEEEEVNTIVPFTQRTEVIVTPDAEYNQYLNTLPDNQRFTPNDRYDSYLYWKLNGRPRDFEEAYNKGMFTYDHSDNAYHANSIAFGPDGVGYFMKPKDHDTVGYELDWFNKGLVTEEGGWQRPETFLEWKESQPFRNSYILMEDPNRTNYYRYQPIERAEGGSIDADLVDRIIMEEGNLSKPTNIGDGKITLGSGLTAQKWHDLYKKRGNKWSAADNRRAVAEEVANRRRWAEKNIPNWDTLPENSQKALLSYKYNYDFNRANSPKLFKALETGNLQEAARQMDATSKDPKFRKGLQARRQREQEWFLSGITPTAPTIPFEQPVSTAVFNPYIQQAENTRIAPVMVPDEDSYVTAHKLTEAEERKQRFQERMETINNFNRLMQMTGVENTAVPAFMPTTGNTFLDSMMGLTKAEGGGIHISPSKRGTFTAAASKHGKSVQAFASQVLAHKENYSTAMVKKANFARNAKKFKHDLGGPLVGMALEQDKNLYGLGDWLKGAYNKAKSVVNKGREIVRDLGLDKSPAQHIAEKVSKVNDKTKSTRQQWNNNLGFWERNGLAAAKVIGLDERYKGNDTDTHYRQNLFNLVDPTSAVPKTLGEAYDYLRTAEKAKSDNDYKYRRTYTDATADAGWAKRLGLPYDNTLLINNPDGSVHLSEQVENEIPTDTIFLKKRIADNEKLLNKNYGTKRQAIALALKFDREALDALRHTYKTGEPVTMHEASHMSRSWINNGKVDYGITPLSILHRYTLQYNKENNTMPYFDTYDFDEFENFVPGKPFQIKGIIDLNKKK